MQQLRWLPWAVFAVMGAGLVSLVLARPIMHDEQMYVGAGAMLAVHSLYSEVPHAQMPYLPWIYHVLFSVFGWDLLGIARGVTLVSVGLAMACCYGLIITLAKKLPDRDPRYVRLVASSAVVLLCMLLTIARLAPYATNHAPALGVTLLALWLFASAVDTEGGTLAFKRMLAGGLCMALAIGIKLTYVIVPVSLLAAIVLSREIPIRTRRKAVLWTAVVLAVGLIPCLVELMRVGWELFHFDNLGYHLANTQWRQATNYRGPLELPDRVQFAWEQLGQPPAVAAAMLLGTAWARSRAVARDPGYKAMRVIARILLAVGLVSFATTIVPSPTQDKYFALPSACLILLAAVVALGVPLGERSPTGTTVAVAAILAIMLGAPRWFRHLKDLPRPGRWTANVVQRDAERLRTALAEASVPEGQPVATLAPIVVLQAGLSVPAVAGCGPFLYRVGDYVPEHIAALRPLLRPATLKDYLAQHHGAVLLGFEPDLDPRWREVVTELGYRRLEAGLSKGEVWVRQ